MIEEKLRFVNEEARQLEDMLKYAQWTVNELKASRQATETYEEPVQHPIRTKLKWTNDDKNYAVAIVTENGILEVKRVCGGETSFTKRLFDSEKSWTETLPVAHVTATPYKSAIDRRLVPLKATSDALKLAELQSRFVGGEFVLSTVNKQYNVTYNEIDTYDYITVVDVCSYGDFTEIGRELGKCTNQSGQPNLMVVYRGNYIDLSYLF